MHRQRAGAYRASAPADVSWQRVGLASHPQDSLVILWDEPAGEDDTVFERVLVAVRDLKLVAHLGRCGGT